MKLKTMIKILATIFLTAIALTIPRIAKAQSLWCQDHYDLRSCVPGDSIVQKGRQTFYVNYELFAFPQEDGVTATTSSKAIDCATGERFSYKITGYADNGRIVFEEKGGVAVAPPAPNGSRGADIAAFVCR